MPRAMTKPAFIATTHAMAAGQALQLTKRQIGDLFPSNPLTGETSMERLKANLVGSAYGDWEITEGLLSDHVTIFRRKVS